MTRDEFRRFVETQRHPGNWDAAFQNAFAPDAKVSVVHPINDLAGVRAYLDQVIHPLQKAFEGLYRRDDIVMFGAFEGGDWISATGYYVGCFTQDWLSIKATQNLAYLRFGEFHRTEKGQIVESYIFFDLPELMIATGQWPITDSPGHKRGYTGLLQGPASQDGLLWTAQAPGAGDKSYQIVTDMLAGLATQNEAWRPYWHPNMMWYGPAAFGSFVGVEDFAKFQVPFEGTFEGWSGGSKNNGHTKHFTRYGDGAYTCSGGWPSLTGVQVGSFLDQPATGRRVYMRVCDWWRREGDLLVENWVFVDIPHVLLQLGYDVFEEIKT